MKEKNLAPAVSFVFAPKSFEANEKSQSTLGEVLSTLATLKASENQALLGLTRIVLDEALESNGQSGGFVINALLSSKDYAVKSYRSKVSKMLRLAGVKFADDGKPESFTYPKDCKTLDDVLEHVEKKLAEEAVNYKPEDDKKDKPKAKVNLKSKKGREEFYEFIQPLYKKALKDNNARLADLINFVALNPVAIDDLRIAMKKDKTAIESKDQIK